jgi:CHAT domain-containing protein/Tfp pilus assembly protein PilF
MARRFAPRPNGPRRAFLAACCAVILLFSSAPATTERIAAARQALRRAAHVYADLAPPDSQAEARTLAPAAPVEQEIAGGQTHSYRVALDSGQFLEVVVEQRGVDLWVKAYGPDGKQTAEANNQNDVRGRESISLIAAASGEHRFEVSAVRKTAAAGRYEIRVESLRAATPDDAARVAAERAYSEGELLRLNGRAESLREAATKYAEARRHWNSLGDRSLEAMAVYKIGLAHDLLSDYPKALEYYGQALEIRRATGNRRGEGQALSSIGVVYAALGDYPKALEHYQQALAIQREAGDRAAEAAVLHSTGTLYWRQGEPQKALEYYNQALALRREADDLRGEGETLIGIGATYRVMGETQNALDYYARALAIKRDVGDRRGAAITLHNMATAYSTLGDFEKALEHFAHSLALRRETGDRAGEGHVLAGMGTAYRFLGDTGKAMENYSQALSIARAVRNRSGEADVLGDMARTHELAGETEKAAELYRQALILQREIGNRRGETFVLSRLGMAHVAAGEPEKGLGYFAEALTLMRAMKDRNGEAEALMGVARAEASRGDLAAARRAAEASLELTELLRTRVAQQELRTTYLALKEADYKFYIDVLMRLHAQQPGAGFDAEALLASERGRARSLLEILAEARADIREGADPSLLERERDLQRRINTKAVHHAQLFGGKNAQQAEAVAKEIDSLLAEYQQVRAEIRRRSPRYAALAQPSPLTADEIRREVLDPETLLLEYSLGAERSFLWAVTHNSLTSHVLPGRVEVERAARRVYDLLTARNQHPAGETPAQRSARLERADAEYAEAASALSRMVLGPVAAQLGTKRLVVVGEGALQYVPFGALPAPASSGGPKKAGSAYRPLVADHEIVALPSASVVAVLRRELKGRAPAHRSVAVLADPVFRGDDPRIMSARMKVKGEAGATPQEAVATIRPSSGLERAARETGVSEFGRLRFSRQEAEAIAALAPPDGTLKAVDFAASRATATSPELARYRVLHFATHGLLNSQRPELSGVVLSLVDEQGQPQDGFLRLHEIYNLRLGAELVVLSACRTALGREVRGEGLIGLTRGFMYAGAPRVVASLWGIDDRATAELMRRFYEGVLKGGQRPAAALRAAQVSMWKEGRWRSPHYWAGFVALGEWR